MSVTLEKYCETSQSKFAKALKEAVQNAVFLSVDEIKIQPFDDGVRARILVEHSITKNDVQFLLNKFDGIFWRFDYSTHTCMFEVVFFLTTE